MNYEEVMESAFKKDSPLFDGGLKGPAEVVHLDGSRFVVYNGYLKVEGRFLILFSEHMHPQVFFVEDLERWEYIDQERFRQLRKA